MVVVFSVVPVLAGCGTRAPASPITDSVFVAVMADLRRLQDTMGLKTDSAMRGEVLRRHSVSADDVEAAAKAFATNPDKASQIWHAIDTKSADPRRPR